MNKKTKNFLLECFSLKHIFIAIVVIIALYFINTQPGFNNRPLGVETGEWECYEYGNADSTISFSLAEGLRLFELKQMYNVSGIDVSYFNDSVRLTESLGNNTFVERTFNCTKWVKVKTSNQLN